MEPPRCPSQFLSIALPANPCIAQNTPVLLPWLPSVHQPCICCPKYTCIELLPRVQKRSHCWMLLWTFFLFFRMNSSLFISIIDAHTSYQHSLPSDSFGHFTNEKEICWVIPVSLQGFLTGGHFFPQGNIWHCLETYLAMTAGKVPLA